MSCDQPRITFKRWSTIAPPRTSPARETERVSNGVDSLWTTFSYRFQFSVQIKPCTMMNHGDENRFTIYRSRVCLFSRTDKTQQQWYTANVKTDKTSITIKVMQPWRRRSSTQPTRRKKNNTKKFNGSTTKQNALIHRMRLDQKVKRARRASALLDRHRRSAHSFSHDSEKENFLLFYQ